MKWIAARAGAVAFVVVLCGISTSSAVDYKKKAEDATSGLDDSTRPKRFVVSAYGLWDDVPATGSLEYLQKQLAALRMLGFNAVHVKRWDLIPIDTIAAEMQQAGIHHVINTGVGERFSEIPALNVADPAHALPDVPPQCAPFDSARSIFDFVPTADDLGCWARRAFAHLVRSNGADPRDVVLANIGDEISWLHPRHTLCACKPFPICEAPLPGPRCPSEFSAYLQRHDPETYETLKAALAPGEVDVPLLGPDQVDVTSRQSRHHFYWSMRFFRDSATTAYKRARDALELAVGNSAMRTFVNLNTDSLLSWFRPVHGSTSDALAVGYLEPLEAGRQHAFMPSTEDWFRDQPMQFWSLRADVLRSAAALGGMDFGAYVIGLDLGSTGHHEDASYRILTLVGHGAKTVSVYNWGPSGGARGEPWSDSDIYEQVAKAVHAVGWGERLLYPGRAARGSVAIMTAGGSRLWDQPRAPDTSQPHYLQEINGLHFALRHAGYTVDFVDDEDLVSEDALSRRGYKVLYVTRPNVSRAAATAIVQWVTQAGGNVVMLPGAATADEFDTCIGAAAACKAPSDAIVNLDMLLGLSERCPVRLTTSDSLGDACNARNAEIIPGYCKRVPPGTAPTERNRCAPVGTSTLSATGTVTFANTSVPGFPTSGTVELVGPVTPLLLDSTSPPTVIATVAATKLPSLRPAEGATSCASASSGAAITVKEHCSATSPAVCGRAFAYGFFPGWEYWNTPDSRVPVDASNRDVGLPCRWKPAARRIVIAPAVAVGTPKPATLLSASMAGTTTADAEVEIDRLDSPDGIALVLANWTFVDLTDVRVLVKDASQFPAITSRYAGTVPATVTGNDLAFNLPSLKFADVLLLEKTTADATTTSTSTGSTSSTSSGSSTSSTTTSTMRSSTSCSTISSTTNSSTSTSRARRSTTTSTIRRHEAFCKDKYARCIATCEYSDRVCRCRCRNAICRCTRRCPTSKCLPG